VDRLQVDAFGAEVVEQADTGGPGGTIRIAVGRPGFHSGVWRVWAGRSQSDVYVARPAEGSGYRSGRQRYTQGWRGSGRAETGRHVKET